MLRYKNVLQHSGWHWSHPLHPWHHRKCSVVCTYLSYSVDSKEFMWSTCECAALKCFYVSQKSFFSITSTLMLLRQVDTINFWFVLLCVLSLLDFLQDFLLFRPPRRLEKEDSIWCFSNLLKGHRISTVETDVNVAQNGKLWDKESPDCLTD